MRLGQLARKLSLRPNEIVAFLANNNIQINDGSNTRIEDEHAMAVVRHFAPGSENFLKEEEEAEPVVVVTAEPIVEREEVELVAEVPTEASVEVIHEESKTEQETDEQEDGVIKAPKIELPGLKVIGKIELPEAKKKEAPASTEEPGMGESAEGEVVTRNAGENKTPHQRRERKELRPRKNPIVLQREREAQEEEKKRNLEKERDKERRTNNYYKKVKPAQPTKAAKLVNEQVIEFHDKLEEKPKSLLTRFVHWLTGR